MSKMEDDAKDLLRRVVWSLSLGLLWLITTIGIGTYNRLIVPENGLHTRNIIFYIWMAVSLVALVWINIRIWKKKIPHG
jgi:hypothetical protein